MVLRMCAWGASLLLERSIGAQNAKSQCSTTQANDLDGLLTAMYTCTALLAQHALLLLLLLLLFGNLS